MKSHRNHKPLLPNERDTIRLKSPYAGIKDGVKRRIDALRSAERNFWFWFEIAESDKAYAANCKLKDHKYVGKNGKILGVCYHGMKDNWCLRQAKKKYERLWEKAKEDGLI